MGRRADHDKSRYEAYSVNNQTSRERHIMAHAMMVLAFLACSMVGAMVPHYRLDIGNCLQLGNVFLSGDLITEHFRHFKHSKRQGPQSV